MNGDTALDEYSRLPAFGQVVGTVFRQLPQANTLNKSMLILRGLNWLAGIY